MKFINPMRRTVRARSAQMVFMLWTAGILFFCGMRAAAQAEETTQWSQFSLARFFDSPVVFCTVIGIFAVFILFYIVVAIRASALERQAASWAGEKALAELVDALTTPDAIHAFVHLRWLRSERLYTILLKLLPREEAASQIKTLLNDLPSENDRKALEDELLLPKTNRKARRKPLARLFDDRDEILRRLLMQSLRQAKTGGPVNVYVIYLLEDLGATEARPLLERLLGTGEIPSTILQNALRRIPQAQEAKAK
ncbi:MAG TPA: hypothetical protein PK395_13295 [bacterium]|nr:hypothetical protein [bacterium]HQP98936.1 hypothetical protein [bacterium]